MSNESALKTFYGSALPAAPDRPLPTMPPSLYTYVRRVSAKQQIGLCLLTLLGFPLTLVPLELQRRIVDDAIAGRETGLLVFLGALYFGVVVIHGMLKFLRNIYQVRVAEGITRLLRRRLAHGDDFDNGTDEGTRQSIMSSEAEKIGGFVAEALAFPLLQAGIILSVAVYMLVVDPLVAAVALAFLAPSLAVVALSQPTLNRLSERKITAVRELGEQVIRDRHEAASGDVDRCIDPIYRLRIRFGIVKHGAKSLNNLINHMGPLSVLMLGGWLVIQGRRGIGRERGFPRQGFGAR
jgi:ABC-type bacteriocin/lantibiotic exporter with double-glycine peptidase domain